MRWFIAGLALLTALSYAVYEWRQEISTFFRRRGWKTWNMQGLKRWLSFRHGFTKT